MLQDLAQVQAAYFFPEGGGCHPDPPSSRLLSQPPQGRFKRLGQGDRRRSLQGKRYLRVTKPRFDWEALAQPNLAHLLDENECTGAEPWPSPGRPRFDTNGDSGSNHLKLPESGPEPKV